MHLNEFECWPREFPDLGWAVVVVSHNPHAVTIAVDAVEVMPKATVGVSIPPTTTTTTTTTTKLYITNQRPVAGIGREPLAAGIHD
jgi:ABC-type Mn2+/Zn2+ transport system ATPase subunit